MKSKVSAAWLAAGCILMAGAPKARAELADSFAAAKASLSERRDVVLEGAAAVQEPEGTLIADKTTFVDVVLNKKTVKCSAADYQAPMLKVLIPALAELTVLNHRNTAEGAPCVSAGRCFEMGPETILGGGEGTERVPVRVVLRKVATRDAAACRVELIESVSTPIRGTEFFHERRQVVAGRVNEDCR
jgi:hypothetical protein